MSWTDERVETLKRMWAEGQSASQIAKELGGVTLYLNTDYRHTSTQFSDLGQSPTTQIDPYGIWNASVGFSDPDDKYRVTFHARNITDDSYVLLNIENGRRLQIPRDADRYFGISLRVRTF